MEDIFPENSLYHEKKLFIPKKTGFKLIYIAIDNDKIIGTVIGTVMEGFFGQRGWIDLTAVHRSYRNKDIGKILVKRMEDNLKKHGCTKINLQIDKLNTSAIEFYKKTGYKIKRLISMCKIID